MKLIYNGTDITDDVDIIKVSASDPAGNVSDRCEVHLSDASGIWSSWKPVKGDEIEIVKDGYSTGNMRIDQIRATLSTIILEALSLPVESKTKGTKAWEYSRFKQIAIDLSKAAGMECEFYDITDYTYTRVDQDDIEPLELLGKLCIREGYRLKISRGKAHIYNEVVFEQKTPVADIEKHEIFYLDYVDKSEDLYRKCIVKSNSLHGLVGIFEDTSMDVARVLKVWDTFSNVEEANRYARNYLRHKNKFEKCMELEMAFNPSIAGSSTINIHGCGLVDGKYFVEDAIPSFTNDRVILIIRKVGGEM